MVTPGVGVWPVAVSAEYPLTVRACHWLIQVPLAHGLPLDSCFPLTSAEANRENNHFLTFILFQWTHLDDRNPHIRKCVWSMWDIFVALEETTGVISVNVSYTLFWFSLCSFMSLGLGKNHNCRFPRSLVERFLEPFGQYSFGGK